MTPADPWLDDEQAPRTVRHGAWSVQLTDDSVDEIRYGGTLVLRAVRWVVRDENWRTVDLVVTHRPLPDGGEDELILAVEGRSVDPAVGVVLTGQLVLRPGVLRYEITGSVRHPFRRNRFGLVALHSPEWAGTPVTVTHPDGTGSDIVVPEEIAPHQPARDIAALRWRVGTLAVEMDVVGDVFEIEDQRNWTDASFKTYSTPLSRPFPVELGPDDAVTQAIEVRCAPSGAGPGRPASAAPVPAGASQHEQSWVFPEIALGASTAPDSAALDSTGPDRRWPGTVLVELDLAAANWRAALARAAGEGERLDVRFVCPGPAPIADAVRSLAGHPVARVGVVDGATHVSEPPLVAALLDALAGMQPGPEPVLGTRAHFTELNRTIQRLDLPDGAGVAFSLTPQMHDRSRRQVIESVPVQRRVAEQAVALAAGARVHIGPVTLRPRFNAVATAPAPPDPAIEVSAGYGAEFVPEATDPRQVSDGVAAWAVASAIALAVPGVVSLAYFETCGPRGVVTAAGELLPMGRAVEWLAELSGGRVLASSPATTADPVTHVAVRTSDTLTVLAANLSAGAREIEITVGAGSPGELTHSAGTVGRVADRDGVLTLTVPAAGAVRWVRS
ncbi:hypothetical protein JL107_08790 [Nakamurella flavida]|uniref:Uncharacterized protein n=1 Tax=Nakamurella flavida TaxID=363630 RepID=A0A939C2Z0_9ACTN|nr:hypothetical protein [Nakamurella flavida]MBM9476536.1 hypothetical protein [Nakamurella flavida]MDP9779026.1 hypothetical protein [Nakamurella flavida]